MRRFDARDIRRREGGPDTGGRRDKGRDREGTVIRKDSGEVAPTGVGSEVDPERTIKVKV